MANPTENLNDRYPIASEPYDATDPPRFGQLTETAKDTFMKELKNFFTYEVSDGATKLTEIPNIEKYYITVDGTSPSLETTVNLIQSYGDTPDKFPQVALTSASVREKPIGIGSNFVDHVQYAPSIEGDVAGPFVLVDEETITLETWPKGYPGDDNEYVQESTITLNSLFISDFGAVTIAELVKTINAQALYYRAYETDDGYLGLKCGGVCAPTTPNYIEITDGDAAFLAAVGLSIGDSDTYTNTDNPPRNKYGTAAEMVINIDCVSDDMTTRQELQDLVYTFFTYYMEKRRFQFLGGSYFSKNHTPEEWFHIIFKKEFNWSAEFVKQRQETEGYDKIYAIRGSVPIIIYDYIDKRLTTAPVFLDQVTFTGVSTFPDGDYGED